MIKGDAILDQIWCRPGKTGVVFLLVGLHWQAVYSGAGKKWERNLKLVDSIFRTILAAPSPLQDTIYPLLVEVTYFHYGSF